jgi:gas vesicle protein
MSNHNEIGPGSLMTAFLFGALAGAAVALLYAPTTGEEARDYLGERMGDGRDRANAATRQSKEALHRHRENLASTFEKVRETYRNAHENEREPEPGA